MRSGMLDIPTTHAEITGVLQSPSHGTDSARSRTGFVFSALHYDPSYLVCPSRINSLSESLISRCSFGSQLLRTPSIALSARLPRHGITEIVPFDAGPLGTADAT